METQYSYIKDLARQYHRLENDPSYLFNELDNIDEDTLYLIIGEYIESTVVFKPVNLLRAELALRLVNKAPISDRFIEEVKQKIREKDQVYFSHFPKEIIEQLANYQEGDRDLFANWKKYWSIFHVFFYRETVKETVQLYLEQISHDLIANLKLEDYATHPVDFYGASNYGSSHCWIALYPIIKESHKETYQFFVALGNEPVAGRKAGHDVKSPVKDLLFSAPTYEQALNHLKDLKSDILSLNRQIRNYFKFSPGPQAVEWEKFKSLSIIGLDFSDIVQQSLSEFNSKAALNIEVGLKEDSQSNQTMNLWLFKTANQGDVVFANKGTNTCLGIGIIKGNYYYDFQAGMYKHQRVVEWITDKVYHHKPGSIKNTKNLFRADTFSPTKHWDFLLKEYMRLYPEITDTLVRYKVVPKDMVAPTSQNEENTGNSVEITEEKGPVSYWWLNANPRIWSITTHDEGQRQTYTTHNEKGNKRRIYKHFTEIKPGDIIIGYESTPSKQIKALYEVTKGIHNTAKGEEIEFEMVEKLDIPVHWNELKNIKILEKCEVFINNQGSLFHLTEEEYDVISEIIDNKNILPDEPEQPQGTTRYTFAEDVEKPFISETNFQAAVKQLRKKKNIILQGPPGVGKTFIARKIAYQIMGEINPANIEMVQFHQSYSYEDFVQGIRPNSRGGLEVKDGIFHTFCQRALAHPEKDFFFIIDEINRGKLSKIFGELMMLMESDKRSKDFAIKLTYAEDEQDQFYIPSNLYIIGTMNTADRSLAMVDYALRRRFAFITLEPEYGEQFASFLQAKGLTDGMIGHINTAVIKVNKKIKEDVNLGEGFQIGHSFFCHFGKDDIETAWWKEIIDFELRPLLEELWFDDPKTVATLVKTLTYK